MYTFLMRKALQDILDLARDREDIVDTESGRGAPNDWMRVAQMAQDALDGVKRPV